MLDFKNSIWQLIQIRTINNDISTEDFTVIVTNENEYYIKVALE
jgi:hypothetical protein